MHDHSGGARAGAVFAIIQYTLIQSDDVSCTRIHTTILRNKNVAKYCSVYLPTVFRNDSPHKPTACAAIDKQTKRKIGEEYVYQKNGKKQIEHGVPDKEWWERRGHL